MEREGPPSTPAATVAIAQTQDSASKPGDAGRDPPPSPSPPPGAFALSGAVDGSRKRAHISYRRKPGDPLYRPLRIYTVDPARRRLQGATATVNVPYEALKPGPVGARFEVVGSPNGLRRVSASGHEEQLLPPYGTVDLDDPRVLIRSGHDPAPCDPVFHHQMAYAVACNTYVAFRHALGREIDWAFPDPRLKLQIHGMDKAQAQYFDAGVIQFGYFAASDRARGRVPPLGTIYLCLSHDVVAHEVTHALVDGLRARFGRKYVSHIDVDAFHEAFADLVALLLRFSYADVVRDAVRETNGEFWRHESFLHFGIQVGQSEGQEALRGTDLFENAKLYDPDEGVYALGTVLVSAIIEALITVYRRKADPFIRLATNGSGIFPPGARYPSDLVDALTHVASRLASQFLTICIRALDYCPPAGVDFGEYLRALVTADFELVPDDPWGYREALIDSFVRRGIYPRRVQSLSEDALRWNKPRTEKPIVDTRLSFASLRFAGDPASPFGPREVRRRARVLGELVTNPAYLDEFGLAAQGDPALGGDSVELPVVESVRSARRVGPDGQVVFDLVCEVTQLRRVRNGNGPDLCYWGGGTIIIDPDGMVRLVVRKSVTDTEQIERMRRYREPPTTDVDPVAPP